MNLIEYYLKYLQELADGSRKPPEGMELTEQEPMARATELQTQIQAKLKTLQRLLVAAI